MWNIKLLFLRMCRSNLGPCDGEDGQGEGGDGGHDKG